MTLRAQFDLTANDGSWLFQIPYWTRVSTHHSMDLGGQQRNPPVNLSYPRFGPSAFCSVARSRSRLPNHGFSGYCLSSSPLLYLTLCIWLWLSWNISSKRIFFPTGKMLQSNFSIEFPHNSYGTCAFCSLTAGTEDSPSLKRFTFCALIRGHSIRWCSAWSGFDFVFRFCPAKLSRKRNQRCPLDSGVRCHTAHTHLWAVMVALLCLHVCHPCHT